MSSRAGLDRSSFDFEVPPELEAREPPEARGLARDQVRLMVAHRHDGRLDDARFRDLPTFLRPGDLLVVNDSGTLPGSLPARREGEPCDVELHLSTPLPSGAGPVDLEAPPGGGPAVWIVELRRSTERGDVSFRGAKPGERLTLPAGATAEIIEGYPPDCGDPDAAQRGVEGSRLWTALLSVPSPLGPYLGANGRPIRYGYVDRDWPVSAYQTVFSLEPGSAEMPSAGRAFTPELVAALIERGVEVAPITLHAGVSSLEDDESPPPEFFRVTQQTARRVNEALAGGGRVIAVGTTAVRAIESAAGPDATVRAAEGWTDLAVTPERGVRVVHGLLTGWHEPRASHLLMLEVIAGRPLLERSYRAALQGRYLWHEFGDLHLILP